MLKQIILIGERRRILALVLYVEMELPNQKSVKSVMMEAIMDINDIVI
jgi:hypothetical protein